MLMSLDLVGLVDHGSVMTTVRIAGMSRLLPGGQAAEL